MYVTVSLKIELNASASLTDMERQIQVAGREAMKAAISTEPALPQRARSRAIDHPKNWQEEIRDGYTQHDTESVMAMRR